MFVWISAFRYRYIYRLELWRLKIFFGFFFFLLAYSFFERNKIFINGIVRLLLYSSARIAVRFALIFQRTIFTYRILNGDSSVLMPFTITYQIFHARNPKLTLWQACPSQTKWFKWGNPKENRHKYASSNSAFIANPTVHIQLNLTHTLFLLLCWIHFF